MCTSDNTSSVNWYSPSRRPLRQQAESPFTARYEDYDYACSYGDRLPAPSPVYSRHGYVMRSSLGNQCDWYARGDGDGRFEPDRYHDDGLQVPDGRSPYRQYEDSVNRSRDPRFLERHRYLGGRGRRCGPRCWHGNGDDNRVFSANRSRDRPGGYYDAEDGGRFLDDGPSRFLDDGPSRFLDDGPSRRNGGIGFDWSTAAPDRKSGYRDDDRLIVGGSGELYSAGDDRSPFDYNTGTVQRRTAVKTSASPYSDDHRAADGMERRLPAQPVPDLNGQSKPEVTSELRQPPLVLNHRRLEIKSVTMKLQPYPVSDRRKLHKPEVTSAQKLVFGGAERRLPVGTEFVAESPYRKEKDRVSRDSPHRGGTSSPSAAKAKNGSQARNRAKVDDIKRLTERDRVPAAVNRKQQNHVTSRGDGARSPLPVDESTSVKQSRSRGRRSPRTPTSTTCGQLLYEKYRKPPFTETWRPVLKLEWHSALDRAHTPLKPLMSQNC